LPLSQPVHQPSSPSAVGGEAETAAPPPATSVGVAPADSALLLLMGASAVVERCVAVGLVSAAAHNIISGSSVVAAGSQGQPSSSASQSFSSGTSTAGTQAGLTIAQQSSGDDLMAAFNALLSLARLLVSDGPWWEEARAKYSLLLIEALFKVGTVSHGWMLCTLAAANAAYVGVHLTSRHTEFSIIMQPFEICTRPNHPHRQLMTVHAICNPAARSSKFLLSCASGVASHVWVPAVPSSTPWFALVAFLPLATAGAGVNC
jgi:hypothetical protein